MSRFYLALLLAVGAARSAAAQAPPDPFPNTDRPPLGSSITVDALGTLPASANIFALVETAVPDVIADRFDGGGLSTGDPARVGAHGSTWTQTTYRVGDADITEPGTSGTPMLVPGVSEWDRVDVSTGIMPPDVSAPGMAVGLVPRQSAQWVRWLDVLGSPPGLNAEGPADKPPAVARLNSWVHSNLVMGGPVRDRAGIFLSAAWTRSSRFERVDPTPLDAHLASLFANVTTAPSKANRLRLVGWVQGTRDPLATHAALAQPTSAEHRRAVHVQAAWERLFDNGSALRTFGNITARGRSTDLQASPFVIVERLTDGPTPSLLDAGDGADRILQVGGRFNRTTRGGGIGSHTLLAGADWTYSFSSLQSAFTGRVGELVNGIPARAWDWVDPAAESRWHSGTFTGLISDTIALSPRVTINGGLRVETVRARASDAADGTEVSWNDLYPRAGLHVALLHFWEIGTFAQYGRYGHRLPLRDLAYGDPAAPTASVYRWNGGDLRLPASLGPLVQRVGPGTGGNPAFSTIDPELTRPAMNEMIFGFESRPRPAIFVRMAAVARREWTLLGAVDVGAPKSSYTTVAVPDTGIDRVGAQDDQLLIFYNRDPSTFGADRYVLTNPDDNVATFVGVDFVGEVHAKRLFAIAGGTAGRSEGLAANRGFGPLENDDGLIGEVFVNPNARDHAQGRLFTERGYTIKTALSYQFDHDLTFGLIGRYQDGEHFARLVVLDTLNQGAEAVRAFRNGRTRFMFTMTVDGRLQKGFVVGGKRFVAALDAYNIFNQSLSVEEDQVTGSGPRISTAVQPPRVIHIGVRIPF